MIITIPYNPRQWAKALHNTTKRWIVVVAHRRSGKTVAAVNHLIRAALIKKGGRYAYIAPLLKQAKDISWDYLKYYSQPIPGIKINESELRIDYPNGSRIRIYGADNPDSLRGIELDGVVMDEYGDMKKEMWDAIISPILYANQDSWAMFIGTPKGKNDFFVKYQKGKDDEEWEAVLLKASESGILTPEALRMARENTPQAFYQQEYECDFTENAGAFFRRIRHNIRKEEKQMEAFRDHEYQLGVDLAKYQDWTVITPFDINTFDVLQQDRFNQVDWNLQKARIEAEYLRHNNAKVVIDSTGVGDPIHEDLERKGMYIEGYKFTEQSRQALLEHLAILLEQDKIKIPNDEGLITELEAFRYELGTLGKVKVKVPDGMHDDRVMSLALAVWGRHQPERIDYFRELEIARKRDDNSNSTYE